MNVHLKINGLPVCEFPDIFATVACTYDDRAAAREAGRRLVNMGDPETRVTIAPGPCPNERKPQ